MAEDHEEKVMRSLKGEFKHYCSDWDYMAIDETHPEFELCNCFDEHVYTSTRLARQAALDEVATGGTNGNA